jgi:CheY-like chemotaxis protein
MAKILLVEDDNNLREIYGARLTAEGYDIIAAPDGEEALAIAVKEKPDLIITDVMMPKISGFDMLDILRNAPETKDTKVIMMTALSQAEDKERADKLGADLYLVKSQVTLEDVAASVKMTLAGKGATQGAEPAAEAPKAEEPAPDPTPTPAPAPEPPKPEPEPVPAPPPAPTPGPEPTPAPSIATPTPAPADDKSAAVAAAPVSTPATQDNTTVPAPDPIPTAPPALSPAPASSPAPDPTPAPAPAPTAEPSPPAPVAVSPAPEPPKPAPKKIEVVLPDAKEEPAKDADKPAEDKPAAAEPPKPPVEATPSQPDIDPALNIGPNLAEALADEEKNTQEPPSEEDEGLKIEGLTVETPAKETSPSSVPPAESAPAPEMPSATEPSIIKPQVNAALDGASATAEQNQDSRPKITGMPGKKVIEPINDLTKTDLNELLAKEEGQSQPAPPADGVNNPPEHPDDFSKISL